MLIDCPGCRKSYHIFKGALGPDGRRVACPRCDAIWFVPGISALAETAALTPKPGRPLAVPHLASGDTGRTFPRVGHGKRQPRLRAGWSLSFAVLALGMALIGWRAEMVRLWPASATLYASLGLPVNLRGLELANFHTVTLIDGHQRVLRIEGEIINLRRETTRLPPIRLSVTDAQGHSLYSWTVVAQKSRLAAGEKLLVRARLAAPPEAGRHLLVDFAGAPTGALTSLLHAASRF
jgi:predicted Zn finger-like uncharacterized protein